ncbi:MAG: DUF1284 domain-containing protein [Euryarchaeota archaeon]|nr:DUF1284 domain-containing protein [Euryarchaeota archaeon]
MPRRRLRPHHLLCVLKFAGEGYSREFVENFWEVLEGLVCGDRLEVVAGGDEICRKCPHFSRGRCFQSGESEERVRRMDALALSRLQVRTGERLDFSEAVRRVLSIPEDELMEVCNGCRWLQRCYSELFEGG